jgi:hypothetical protein
MTEVESICTLGTNALPPEAQMNFDRLNFGKMSGASPSSSVSEGIMLQMSILA